MIYKKIFFGILVALGLLYFWLDGRFDFFITTVHFLIIALALWQLATVKSFNLGAAFAFFSLFFFGLIPLFEYKLDILYHGSAPSYESFLRSGLFALLSGGCFFFGYSAIWPARLDGRQRAIQIINGAALRGGRRLILYVVLSLSATALLVQHQFDLFLLFSRGAAEQIEFSAADYSIGNFFLRPLVFNILLFKLLLMRYEDKGGGFPRAVILGLMFLLISPVGIPRSLAGALYIALLVTYFAPKLQHKYATASILVVAIIFVAPVFDVFRRVIDPESEINLLGNFSLSYFFAGHFDAFQNFVHVIDRDYDSGGMQLIGALLFWIPRSIWADKPIGSSFLFAELEGWRAQNVSFPLHADFYADFGLLGLVIGMLALGFVFRICDQAIFRSLATFDNAAYIRMIARVELSIMCIYLLRGNFLSALAFTTAVATSLLIIHFLVSRRVVFRFPGVRAGERRGKREVGVEN